MCCVLCVVRSLLFADDGSLFLVVVCCLLSCVVFAGFVRFFIVRCLLFAACCLVWCLARCVSFVIVDCC